MNVESLMPLLIIPTLFLIAFLLEALVVYFFRIKKFWASIGTSLLINLLAIVVLYIACFLLSKVGYEFNAMQFPVQVFFFLWWVSVIADGILLQLFSRRIEKKQVYSASIVMNTISYLFLYFFISNSH